MPWNPNTPFINTATYWVNQPSLYSFKQRINISGIAPFSYSNTINMEGTTMPTTDTAPSTTFTSAYLNIFSNYSNPLVDNTTKCINPFPYKFADLYNIWVLWCPIQVGFTNQILFSFPLYPDVLGAGFPFSLMFTYAYANTSGAMIGYRVENTTGGLPQVCKVARSSIYNKNTTLPQENVFEIVVSPFKLSAATHTKFMVTYSIPLQIPITVLSCTGMEQSQSVPLNCNILSQLANVIKI